MNKRDEQTERMVEAATPCFELSRDDAGYRISRDDAILLRRAAIQWLRSLDNALGYETRVVRVEREE